MKEGRREGGKASEGGKEGRNEGIKDWRREGVIARGPPSLVLLDSLSFPRPCLIVLPVVQVGAVVYKLQERISPVISH